MFLLDGTIADNIRFSRIGRTADRRRPVERARAGPDRRFRGHACPTASRPWWASGASGSPAGSASDSGIARALFRNPEVLILDEATSALDTATEAAVAETISSLEGTLTMVIIAHRLSTVRDCDSARADGPTVESWPRATSTPSGARATLFSEFARLSHIEVGQI